MLGTGSAYSLGLGQLGSDFIYDTDAHIGHWGMIQCITACTFTVLTSDTFPQRPDVSVMTGDLTNLTLSPGMIIWGKWSAITLGVGSVIAYNIE